MNWSDLPRGLFTGIDWARKKALDGWDPYLVWAEADRFSGYGERRPRRLPVAIELKNDVTVDQLVKAAKGSLRVPKVYASPFAPAGFRFCTGDAKPAFFAALHAGGALGKLVERVELGLPAAPYTGEKPPAEHRRPPTSVGARYRREAAAERPLTGKVVGIIDDSLALAHANFLAGGRARTRYFWRQDGHGVGGVPGELGYGHELSAADIDAAMRHHTHAGMVDESAVYTSLGLSGLGRKWPSGEMRFRALDGLASHGTHVLDLFAGPRTLLSQIAGVPPGLDAPPSWALAEDDASRAPLVAVQLDYSTVADTSGGSLNVHVLDGLLYILSCCAPDARIVVNVSFGTVAGPHDGTSVLEAAMDELVRLNQGRLQVTLAAGNSYQQRTHANFTLAPRKTQELRWQVLPDDTTQNFLEIWIEEDCDGVEIEVVPPGRDALPVLKIGEGKMWAADGKTPLCALIYPRRTATGRRGTCALLAVGPTTALGPAAALAPSGPWLVNLRNRGATEATIDAYVERDDVVGGTHTGARQSHFEDETYDTSGNPDSFVDHPGNPTVIRRSGSFNSIATGHGTLSVGGTRMTGPEWAHYSPQRPDPDPERKQRPGVRSEPDDRAVSDEHPVLEGVNGAGPRSGDVVRLRGTSSAAPQVARALLNAATRVRKP